MKTAASLLKPSGQKKIYISQQSSLLLHKLSSSYNLSTDPRTSSSSLDRAKMRMSCNGCRVLRKGCSDNCSIRPCLQWIKSPEAQAHATVFLAKFYGRAGLMNLINAGPEHLRPAIFRSLLYEACGRIVNPIYGSVGLLWSGSWQLCQSAVEAVLKGEIITPIENEAAANGQGPPLKAYDIRHVSKEENSGDDHHRIKSRCRFKRPSASGAVVKPKVRRAGFCSVADSATARNGEFCADELNRSTSHESSVSHESEAGAPNVDGESKETESMISEETTAAMFGASEPDPSSQKLSSPGSREAVELDLTLGLEPPTATAAYHAVVPVKKRRFEAEEFGWAENRVGSCKMELGLDYNTS